MMPSKYIITSFILSVFFISEIAYAQMSVTIDSNATNLAQKIAGFGVTVSNAALNCKTTGTGSFSYSGASMTLTNGVLLTTGTATDVANAQTYFCSVSTGNHFSDPQLTSIDSKNQYDNCILEFDFVPLYATLNIKYVFGSEEYPVYVGSQFNDGFGIFLTGGSYNGTNIATAPNGQPVSINNVNANANASSFVPNYTLDYQDIAWGGYTQVITSSANVTPCQTYHLKIGVADAGDPVLDSGVMLEQDGLTSVGSPSVVATTTPAGCNQSDGSATVTLANYPGTAQYTWLPGGQTTNSITNVPAGTYTCNIGITTVCGPYSKQVEIIVPSISPIPTVAITSNTPCVDGTMTFTAVSTPTNVTYSWVGPNGFTSSIQNPSILNVSATTAGVYTLTASGSGGCAAIKTYSASVLSNGPISVTNNGPYCSGSTINFTASSGGTSYSWTGPNSYSDVTTVNTSSIANSTGSLSGVYSVAITHTNGCVTTTTTNVDVVQTAPVTITSPVVVCQGQSINLLANANGAVAYDWSGPLGYLAINEQNPIILNSTQTMSGAYNITAYFTSNNYTCTTTNTVNVTVNTSIVVNLPSMPTICDNGTITLTGPSGADTYAWSGPNNFLSLDPTVNITNANLNNAGTYVLTTTYNNCSYTGTVSVAVYPPLSLFISPITSTICVGASVPVTTIAQGGSGSYLYNWQPGTGLSSTTTSSVVATPTSTQIYTVTLSDSNCPITPTVDGVSEVVVNPLPSVDFTADKLSGCEPLPINFVYTSIPASTNCYWDFGGGLTVTNNGTSVDVPYNDDGMYTVGLTVTDINGCINTLIKPNYITIYPKPNADFTWDPNKPNIGEGLVQFTNTTILESITGTWLWDFGDTTVLPIYNVSTNQHPLYTYEEQGTYLVALIATNSYGCKDTVLKPLFVENEFMMYIPNAFTPNNDAVNDVFNPVGRGFNSEDYVLQIFERWGEKIFESSNAYKGWDGTAKNGSAMAQQDAYIYRILVTDFKGKKHEFNGHVTLVK